MTTNNTLFTLATVAALSLLGAGSAMAAGEFLDAPAPAVSTLSRAAVQADYLAARNSGSLVVAGEGVAAGQGATTGATTGATMVLASAGPDRAAVIAELLAARAAGTLTAAGEGQAADRVPASRSNRPGSNVAQTEAPVTR